MLSNGSNSCRSTEKDPPNELHADVNEGASDIVVIVMELKEDAERESESWNKLGEPPFVMPAGWEPPTTKRADAA